MSSKTGPETPPKITLDVKDRPSWSLAARLTAWYAVTAFCLVLAATGFLYLVLVESLDHEDDEVLADKVRVLRATLRNRPGDVVAIRQEVEGTAAARQFAAVSLRLLDDQGRVLVESPGLGQALPADTFPRPVPDDAEPGTGINLHSSEGKSYRVVAARVPGGERTAATCVIQVALDRSPEEQMLAGYRRRLWVVLGLALVACAAGGYTIARRGIRPLQDIIATARRIRSATLSERLAPAGLPAELALLANTFNEMLDRLEESFARLSQFSADIAHELRTPINNLRGEAEVALGKPRSAEEYRDVLGSSLEECVRLSRLIDSLLFLARAERPETRLSREEIQVGRQLEAVQEFYEAAANEAGVRLQVKLQDDVVADLDRGLFQRALGNLVENALAHTARGGAVTLSVAREGHRFQVAVADTGCGIPAEHLPSLCDRFYRVDPSRSSGRGGLGLGLALVKSITELHGGSVEVSSQVGHGTRVVLWFPAPSSLAGVGCCPQMTKM